MKIKVLLTPLIGMIAVTLLIWLVYPAYSNGVDGVKEKKIQLKKEQSKLTNLRGKISNVDTFSGQLNSLSSEKEVLYRFIPEFIEEELIYDSLNFYAFASGISILGASTGNLERSAESNTGESVDAQGPVEEGGVSGDNPLPKLPKARNFETRINLIGGYENIKKFLGYIEKINRHNSLASLRITKNLTQDGEDASSYFLTAELTLDFEILEKAKLSANSTASAIFSQNQFDTEIISQIKSQIEPSTFKLTVDQKGKSNLFAL